MDFPKPSVQLDKRDGLAIPSVLIPVGPVRAGVWVPPDYNDTIVCHILKNDIQKDIPDLTPPLILAIQGPAGEGKSFQAREVCSRTGVYLVTISGAFLSGPYERDAVAVLEKAYAYASAIKNNVNRVTALLIDDFDLSVAATIEDRRYAVNTQLLTGFLMNLADEPTLCGTSRIPIIITGNNFKTLHVPLIRHGRMTLFDWKPSLEQKIQIVRTIFASMLLPREIDKLKELVETYADQALSFFVALKDDVVDEAIREVIRRDKGIDMPSIQHVIIEALRGQNITLQELYDAAVKRRTMRPRNFLEPDDKDPGSRE
jgi:ATP-dependent 26S proteasome regulatory subunit